MKKLAEDLRAIIKKHPSLQSQIADLYELCRDEIEEGGSEQHEIELCRGSVNDLVKEIEAKA